MIFFIGLILILIGAKIAMIDVENSNLPKETPVVFIGVILILVGYLFTTSYNISKTLENEILSPAIIDSDF